MIPLNQFFISNNQNIENFIISWLYLFLLEYIIMPPINKFLLLLSGGVAFLSFNYFRTKIPKTTENNFNENIIETKKNINHEKLAQEYFLKNKLSFVTMKRIKENKTNSEYLERDTELTFYAPYGVLCEEKINDDHKDYTINDLYKHKPGQSLGTLNIGQLNNDSLKDKNNFCPIYDYAKNYFHNGNVQYFEDKLHAWDQSWKRKEIESNDLGHVNEMAKKYDFNKMYDNLSDDNKNIINYFAGITQTMVYFEKMYRKYSDFKYYNSIQEMMYGPIPYYGVIKKYDSIGVDVASSSGSLLTPMGKFFFFFIIYLNMGNNLRDIEIKNKLELKETIAGYYEKNYGQIGPYYSIMKNINGDKMEHFQYAEKKPVYDDVRNFWNQHRELIFFKAMENMKSH